MKPSSKAALLILMCFFLGCSEEPVITTKSAASLPLYHRGVDLWEKFYFSEAKAALDSALILDSTFAMGWARLALVKLGAQDEKGAREAIGNALACSHHATQREQLYVRMWNSMIGFQAKEAALVADSIINKRPEEKEAHVFRGKFYENNQKLDAAIRSYQRAVELDTSYAHAVMLLGYAYSTAGEQEKAIAQMERYIRLAPDAADPRASFADLLLRVGRYDDALKQYRASLDLKPDYWYSIIQIGVVYAVLGRLDDAGKQFERGYSHLPRNSQLDAVRMAHEAGLNLQRGQFQESVNQYKGALRVDSTNGSAAYGLVHALAKLKKFKDAGYVIQRIHEELERRGLLESQQMLGFHLLRARFFIERNMPDSAEVECQRAIEFSSPLSRPAVYRHFAEIHLKRKTFESAFDACEVALSVNPNSTPALLTLARVYNAKGDRRMTAEIGWRLLELWKNADPDFQDALEGRKMLGGQRPS